MKIPAINLANNIKLVYYGVGVINLLTQVLFADYHHLVIIDDICYWQQSN